jgi:DNA-binding NtrC family response regulator
MQMRVLYLSETSDAQPTPEALLRHGYQVVPVQALHDALELVRTEHFDAIVVPEEMEDPEIMTAFTAHAHRAQPKLPVFLLNDWVFDLLAALESLGMPENTHEAAN